jgi:hypothetical protein
MSTRAAPVSSRSASTRARAAAPRRRQRDSEALLVAILTLLATGIAFYDLLLFAFGTR